MTFSPTSLLTSLNFRDSWKLCRESERIANTRSCAASTTSRSSWQLKRTFCRTFWNHEKIQRYLCKQYSCPSSVEARRGRPNKVPMWCEREISRSSSEPDYIAWEGSRRFGNSSSVAMHHLSFKNSESLSISDMDFRSLATETIFFAIDDASRNLDLLVLLGSCKNWNMWPNENTEYRTVLSFFTEIRIRFLLFSTSAWPSWEFDRNMTLLLRWRWHRTADLSAQNSVTTVYHVFTRSVCFVKCLRSGKLKKFVPNQWRGLHSGRMRLFFFIELEISAKLFQFIRWCLLTNAKFLWGALAV